MTMFRSWRSILIVLFAIFALVSTPALGARPAAPQPNNDAHHESTPVASQPAPTVVTVSPGQNQVTPGSGWMMEAQEFDLMFIDMMILHHQGAISMAEVALERGEHPELVSLAQQIIDAQQSEIKQMQALRGEWYPDAPELSMSQAQMMGGGQMMGGMGPMMEGTPGMQTLVGMMGMEMMDPEASAEALLTTTRSFDLAFLNAMIPHHLMALMMTEMAVQYASHAELAELAGTMSAAQESELAQMRAWRATW